MLLQIAQYKLLINIHHIFLHYIFYKVRSYEAERVWEALDINGPKQDVFWASSIYKSPATFKYQHIPWKISFPQAI